MTEISPLSQAQPCPNLTRALSTSSLRSLAASLLSNASTTSLSLPPLDEDVEVVTAEGVRHAPVKLEARKYKSIEFKQSLLAMIAVHKLPTWYKTPIAPGAVQVDKVSGSMTNAVFFISCPLLPTVRTYLLRIYGSSSGSLVSRPRELHTLHMLSSKYGIGPRVFGTFENGRIEEYFDSTTLTASDLRDEKISRWIGARMADLHSVDIATVELSDGTPNGFEIGVKKNVSSWLQPAEAVLKLPNVPKATRRELDLPRFKKEWKAYMQDLAAVDDIHGESRRVFAHNDTQYGNLLRLKWLREGASDHEQIIVVDFEYASPNPATFDIANHFHEWTADYHGPTPHLLNLARYPTQEQRRNFYIAYQAQRSLPADEVRLQRLDEQVKLWSPASHAMWAIWGLVQARENLEANVTDPEFDYIGYAKGRMEGFRREAQELRKLGLLG